jgi:hypothetical protein
MSAQNIIDSDSDLQRLAEKKCSWVSSCTHRFVQPMANNSRFDNDHVAEAYAKAMYERLPRELRDMLYEHLWRSTTLNHNPVMQDIAMTGRLFLKPQIVGSDFAKEAAQWYFEHGCLGHPVPVKDLPTFLGKDAFGTKVTPDACHIPVALRHSQCCRHRRTSHHFPIIQHRRAISCFARNQTHPGFNSQDTSSLGLQSMHCNPQTTGLGPTALERSPHLRGAWKRVPAGILYFRQSLW